MWGNGDLQLSKSPIVRENDTSNQEVDSEAGGRPVRETEPEKGCLKRRQNEGPSWVLQVGRQEWICGKGPAGFCPHPFQHFLQVVPELHEQIDLPAGAAIHRVDLCRAETMMPLGAQGRKATHS